MRNGRIWAPDGVGGRLPGVPPHEMTHLGDVSAEAIERRWQGVIRLRNTGRKSPTKGRPSTSPRGGRFADEHDADKGLPSAKTRESRWIQPQPSNASSIARSTPSEGAVRAVRAADWIRTSGARASARATGIAAGALLMRRG